jgi:hypothetical protein
LDILFRYCGRYPTASRWRLAMTRLVKKRLLLPVELMMILGINLVVIMLSYYAIMVWGLFRS